MSNEFATLSSNFIRGNVEPMIMMTLLQGELYGLEILDKIKDASGGTYVLKQPTLYSALKRLEDKKMIRGRYVDVPNAARRKYFMLTDNGKNSFLNKKEDWRSSKDILDYFFFSQMSKFGKNSEMAESDSLMQELMRMREELDEAHAQRASKDEELLAVRHVLETQQMQTRSAELIEQFVEEKTQTQTPEPESQFFSDRQLEQLRQLREVGVVPVEQDDEERLRLEELAQELEKRDQDIAALENELAQTKQSVEEQIEEHADALRKEIDEIACKIQDQAQNELSEEAVKTTQEESEIGDIQKNDEDSTSSSNNGALSPQYITQYFISGDYYLGGGNSNTNVARKDDDDAFSLPLTCGDCAVEIRDTDIEQNEVYNNDLINSNKLNEPVESSFEEIRPQIFEAPQEISTQQEIKPYILNQQNHLTEQNEAKEAACAQIFQKSSHEEIAYLREQSTHNHHSSTHHSEIHHHHHYAYADDGMKRYIGPNEYAVWQKTGEGKEFAQVKLPVDDEQKPIVIEHDGTSIEIRPFTKHFSRLKNGDFILYNRLKAAVSGLVAVFLIFSVVLTWDLLKSVYQQNEEVMFILAYVAISVYVLINLAIWAVYPRMRRINGCYKNELIIRSCVTASILAIILGVNIIMGLSNVNTDEHIVFFIVPSILSVGIILEWVGIHFLKRINLFRG